MNFSLATLARRQRNIRRPSIVIRDIAPPSLLAANLYSQAYKPIGTAWAGYAERIIAEYERTLAQITTDAPADVHAEIESAGSALNRLMLLLTPEVRNWALSVEKWQREKWTGAVLSATSVDLSTMIGASDVRATLETSINWNVALIKDVSAQAQQRISNAVFDGLRNRTPAREVAKAVREAVTMSRRRSVAIASDQLSKITSSLADERRRQAGLPIWEWLHSRKAHPRANHIVRNGNYYSDDPDAVGQVIGGKTVMAPPQDRPTQLPFCGCRSRSVISFD